MSSSRSSIESMVHRLEPGDRVGGPDEVEVWIDGKSGTATTKRPWFRASNYARYVVRPARGAVFAPMRLSVALPASDARDVDATLGVRRCRIEAAAHFASHCHGFESVEEAMSSALTRWIEEFFHEQALEGIDVGQHYRSLIGRAPKHVRQKADEELGLDITIDLKAPGYAGDFKITLDDLPVQAKDSDEELHVSVEVDLTPPSTDGAPSSAHYPSPQRLEADLASAVTTRLAGVSIHTWAFEKHDIDAHARTAANSALLPHGFTIKTFRARPKPIAAFRLTRDGTPQTSPHVSIDNITIACRVEPQDTNVTVQHKLLLELESLGKLRRSGCADDVHAFVTTTLEHETRSALFGKSFVDLVLSFEETRVTIEERVRAKLGSAGWAIRQIITIPELDEHRLVEEGTLFDAEGTFSTADNRVQYKLSLLLNGKVRDLRSLRRHITPGWDYASLFLGAAQEAAADVVRELAPETLFLRFEQPLEGDLPKSVVAAYAGEPLPTENPSPKAAICRAVEARLDRAFDIQARLTPTPVETRLTKRFTTLKQGGNRRFELDIKPLNDPGDKIPFSVDYRITDLDKDGWSTFQEGCVAMETPDEHLSHITAMIEGIVQRNLKVVPAAQLRYEDFGTNAAMRSTMFAEAKERVRMHFGLIIDIVNLDRELSESEIRTGDGDVADDKRIADARSADMQSLVDQITGLQTRKAQLRAVAETSDDFDEIDALTKNIAQIQDELTELTRKRNDKRRELGAPERRDFSFKLFLPGKSQTATDHADKSKDSDGGAAAES